VAPTARDKLDLRVAKQNMNLCRATVAAVATVRYHAGQKLAGRRMAAGLQP
jgi:hypothetical protein